jgi:hypothetical protein
LSLSRFFRRFLAFLINLEDGDQIVIIASNAGMLLFFISRATAFSISC